jgi:hypothetical protein
MRSALGTLTVAAVLIAAGLAIQPAGASAAPLSKVSIKLSGNGTSIVGKVKSKHSKCKRDREVKLQTEERGLFRKQSQTNRRGRYRIGGPGASFGQPMPAAHYFVTAFRKGKDCPSAKSKVLEVE